MTVATSPRLMPAAALRGMINVPSDKSIAHRALICAALASGVSRIGLRTPGEDVRSTLRALQSLGVQADATELEDGLQVEVTGLGDTGALGRLGRGVGDCGNSGTSMRLLAGALASGCGAATLVGDRSLSRRPMARVADPLRAMGAEIDLTYGHAPVRVRGLRPLRAMEHRLPVASAQVLGAICLAALAADGTTTITVPSIVRDHSERMLSALGADITRTTDSNGTTTSITGPGGLRSFEMSVPGDFSSASAWILAGALHADAGLLITGVGLNPTRTALIDVLRAMGADIEVGHEGEQAGEPVGSIRVRGGSSLSAVTLGGADVAPLIDELPLLAVAMAAAHGTSEVRGASELRVKESDRIAAMAAALTAMGANVEELEDGWRISAGRPLDATVVTHADHRIAMAGAVAAWAGVARSVVLDDPECVAISYPTFWHDARLIGIES
jgi:3-phosphoshikimate 1-carboxyvinyltransferase